ncbi:MAG: nicotinate-nicotinamide nucleotide adenylyltransferase [Myxococcota bacterium]
MTAPAAEIAVFGGTFDPPHVAHVLAVASVLSAASVRQVWVFPVAHHVLGKTPGVSFADRMDLCRRAFAIFGDRVVVRDDEACPGASGATVDLVVWLQERHPDANFRLVIGSDLLHERHRWKQFDRLADLAPPLVLRRPGYAVEAAFLDHTLAVELPDISSTDLRQRLRSGEPLPLGLLPREVAAAIADRGLYGS